MENIVPKLERPHLLNTKNRSQSLATGDLIDLEDFDPLLKANLEPEQNEDDFEKLEVPKPTLIDKPNATSYALLDKVLQIVRQPGSNFDAEAQKLIKYTEAINESIKLDSLFLAPNVIYCTTRAESVKLIVYEDKT
jgi:hypothetical protein